MPEHVLKALAIDDRQVFLVSEPEEATTLEDALSTVVMVSKGYVEDPRNTDNAWVERMSLNLHGAHDVFHLQQDVQGGVKWVELSNNLAVPASQQTLLQKVAAMRRAYFADQVAERRGNVERVRMLFASHACWRYHRFPSCCAR